MTHQAWFEKINNEECENCPHWYNHKKEEFCPNCGFPSDEYDPTHKIFKIKNEE